MRAVISILFLVLTWSVLQAQNALYVSDAFSLRLFNQNGFVFYSSFEGAAKENVAGSFIIKNDSLVLTTHKTDNETAIFAIYQMCDYNLQLVYKQKQFVKTIPETFYLLKNMYTSGKTKDEYIWQDKNEGDFTYYAFAESGAVQKIYHYVQFQKEGKQLLFFPNDYGAVQCEENYKNGLLNGKTYYYEQADEYFIKVALVKTEKYKEGTLVNSKTFNSPQTYFSRVY